MTHESTLQAALSGGPVSVDVHEHLAGCAPCRQELEALRSLERDLTRAIPRGPASGAWEEGLIRKLAVSPVP